MAKRITRKHAAKVLEVIDAGLVSGVGDPVPGQMCIEAAVCFALGEPHGDEPSCVAPALRAFKVALNDAGWSSPAARAAGMRRLGIAQLGSAGALDQIEFAGRVAILSVTAVVPRVLRLAASMKMPEKHSKALREAASKCETAADLSAAGAASDAASCAARDAASYAARAARDAASYAARAARAASYAARDAASYAARDARAASYAARDAASYAAHAARAARAARAASYAASDAASYAAHAARYAARDAASAASAASYAASAASDQELSTAAEAVVQILIEMKAPGTKWLDLAPLPEAA